MAARTPKMNHTSADPADGRDAPLVSEQYPSHSPAWVEDAEHEIQVPVTRIQLQDTNGRPNEPVQVYRTVGPGSVPEHGLPALRDPWIDARQDTETYPARGNRLTDDGRAAVRRGAPSQ